MQQHLRRCPFETNPRPTPNSKGSDVQIGDSTERHQNKMCQTLVTQLSCGHTIHGPLIQCDAAIATTPQGPPHDDGRMVLCQPGSLLEIEQNTCCERCCSDMIVGMLRGSCYRCRRSLVWRMGSAIIDWLQHPRVASFSPSPSGSSRESIGSDRASEDVHHW